MTLALSTSSTYPLLLVRMEEGVPSGVSFGMARVGVEVAMGLEMGDPVDTASLLARIYERMSLSFLGCSLLVAKRSEIDLFAMSFILW